MNWPPYSPALTTCDFLWCILKDIVFRNKLSTLEELEEFICEAWVFNSVDPLQRVSENFILRMRHLILHIINQLRCDCNGCFQRTFYSFLLGLCTEDTAYGATYR
ncbi:hypothetical protein AVEN_3163-1 [Araneus ventricosus]|uniref:Tc1-like transposase DDE domain-containing protein n=1 Tax=Araneus ventricosus TaxID=182803 RepID=A0A4Y2HHA2_ARAVE|nr:hypothetical protein AVEN_3163-1 [Araneus ventricosus]